MNSLTQLPVAVPTTLPPIHQEVVVRFQYDVHFTSGLFQVSNPLLAEAIATDLEAKPKRVLVVVDAGVAGSHPNLLSQIQDYAVRYGDRLTLVADPLVVPGGEAVKNAVEWVEKIHLLIDQVGLCRHSYVMAIGGGAMLDMVGYAAATAHRGIRLIRVPTTVLAQDDSGVGVKNGINAFGKKNFLGTFAPPTLVLNDVDFLLSLDDRDWRSGIAEAVKVALIKDRLFFEWIESHAGKLAKRDIHALQQVIYQSARHHLNHIANYGDPFEMGSSRPLDFGHWSAHRLEHLTQYGLRHGEAVAIGMALDSTYSHLCGLLSRSEWQRILNTLKVLGFTLYVPQLGAHLDDPLHPQSVFRGLNEFREHLGGQLTLMLLNSIGRGVEVHAVDFGLYRKAIDLLREI